MASENEVSVGLRETEGDDERRIVKVQGVLGLIATTCFFLSFYFFDRGNHRASDPMKLDLIMVCLALILPLLVFLMSGLRTILSSNHPKWCFVVEMLQTCSSSLTMLGSIQISIMQDEEENFLYCFAFLIVSLILVVIIIENTEDSGLCDMLVALFSTKLNNKHSKYVFVVCFFSYFSRRLGIFTMQKLKNERAEFNERELELREANRTRDLVTLNEMSRCWLATEEKLATGQPESYLEMNYPEFYGMRVLIHEMKERAQGA